MKVGELFHIKYGINMELNACDVTNDDDGINFVARTADNNGVVAKVKPIAGKTPQPAGVITCAGGGSVLSAFVQYKPFYSGRDLYLLTPKRKMRLEEKLFYCHCIKMNAYRYTYGRQANKTLKDIDLPSLPDWLKTFTIQDFCTVVFDTVKKRCHTLIKQTNQIRFPTNGEQQFDILGEEKNTMKVKDLFDLEQGNSFELINMNIDRNSDINFVARTSENNGITAQVQQLAGVEPFPVGCITVALSGSVLSSFVQDKPFYTAFHVMVLHPKTKMRLEEKLFYCHCIKMNACRYTFGRQANKTLKDINLPRPPNWLKNFSINQLLSEKVLVIQSLFELSQKG